MEKILTVTIPSYNVEKYLRETLDSFLSKEVLDEIEILVVNDGSKDTTAEIGTEYERNYPGTVRLITKENGGHGSTINRGILEAQGRYFKVVDGDDWVDTKAFVQMVHCLKTSAADYVVTNYYKVNDITKEKKAVTFPYLKSNPICTFEEASQAEIPMHALVIRTALLKEHHIRLDEHCFYVDNEYITFPVPYVKSVEYYDLTVYMYRLAVAAQSVSMKGFQNHLADHVKVTLRLAEFAEEYRKRTSGQINDAAQNNSLLSGVKFTEKKAAYLLNQAAVMVGDQAGIYASFPAGDIEIKKQFIDFDRTVKEISIEVYKRAGEKSHMLKALRKHDFKNYQFWVTLSKIRARMN